MEINQLIQFKEVANSENMSLAAKKLYISQPALSQSISKLEKECGVNLFDRNKNKLTLNKYGAIVLKHVDSILNEISQIKTDINNEISQNCTLRLSSPEDPSLRYFGAIIVEKYPSLIVDTSIKKEEEIEQQLLNDSIDIAFTNEPIMIDGIFTTYLCETYLHISIPQSHTLYHFDSLTWDQLNNQFFLVPAGFSYLFDKISTVEAQKKIHINRLIQRDFGLYRNMVLNTQYLNFSSTLDHMYTINVQRKEVPVINPQIAIKYYASCNSKRLVKLLHYITAIQAVYWSYERFED